MTVHLYFVPVVMPDGERVPKYVAGSAPLVACNWGMMDYGLIDLAFLAADVTLAQHQTLFDQADVLSIDPRNGTSRNLDGLATAGEVAALKSYLDTAGNFVPMAWATTADTRRAILRGVCGMFLFMQRLHGLSNSSPLTWGVTLATTWGQLTQQQRDWILQAAADIGYTGQTPANGTTLRTILKTVGDGWGTKPIGLGGLL